MLKFLCIFEKCGCIRKNNILKCQVKHKQMKQKLWSDFISSKYCYCMQFYLHIAALNDLEGT